MHNKSLKQQIIVVELLFARNTTNNKTLNKLQPSNIQMKGAHYIQNNSYMYLTTILDSKQMCSHHYNLQGNNINHHYTS